MYFPIGWPKTLNLALPGGDCATINHICCDAVKILVAAAGDDFVGLWYANPLIPITFNRRKREAVAEHGANRFIVWKPDSRQLVVLTSLGHLLLYQIDFDANGSGILTQIDPPSANLKRDSAELFIKENIPRLSLRELCSIALDATITTVCCISLTELLIATDRCELIRMPWTDLEADSSSSAGVTATNDNGVGANGAYTTIQLRQIPFYVNQNCHLKSLPPIGDNAYVAALEYSPFIGGCAAVFSDSRAAFLIAMHLRFETANMHGFWVTDVENATVCSVNHKFRLLAYGRHNSDVNVYAIEDATGGLEFSHRLSLNSNVGPGNLGAVAELKWSPDGCVLAVAWRHGGIALWSTFGTLLMSSLSWDFGLHVDLLHRNPLQANRLEWSTEGYQLFLTCATPALDVDTEPGRANVLQLNFVKSTLAINPCMASHSHVLLQGDDTLYLNQGDNLEKIYFGSKGTFPNNHTQRSASEDGASRSRSGGSGDGDGVGVGPDDSIEIKKAVDFSSILSESKYWTVLQLPLTYASTNWPIRYSAIDDEGLHLAVAGRTGLAHYSMLTKKWKLFGNESQEKDFVVSGGLMWWKGFVVMGCYSLLDRTDEIRCYPEECKLDNQFGNKIQVRAPVISLNMFRDQLIALTADGIVSLFVLRRRDAYSLNVECAYEVDVKSICIHPACIVSLTVTNLRNDLTTKSAAPPATTSGDTAETIIVNVCGRILMIQRDSRNSVINSLMASCLASCVECFWLSNGLDKSPMRDCLWLYSGAHGMRVWLPILPPTVDEQVRDAPHRMHTFMSKRIMLSFPLKLYPLVILFDNVIVLGVENETTLYTSESSSHFALPFCTLERKSQVYLHKILRQLIKRNLGYSAWEIAKSCRSLPYFPHSLELLLHEVLEEEATSKEPIPDALLPSILDFIREFPVYLQTIVQCARKTEIALWPYLFSMAGKPKDLFLQCLQSEEMETAASYLIILQNLEPSVISKQYATLLLDIALQNRKWELAKDLIRFLKAIDPNEIDSPRSSMVVNMKIAPPAQSQSQVNQNPEVFNMILGPIARERSFSTTVIGNLPKEKPKEKLPPPPAVATPTPANATPSLSAASNEAGGQPSSTSTPNGPIAVMRRKSERSNSTKERKETFCIDAILQRHARSLLHRCKVIDLGYMSAFLDFHLVSWLSQEADRSAKLDDFVEALQCLHEELQLPAPFSQSLLLDDSALSMPADYSQVQQHFQLDGQNNVTHASSQTSESGYFSVAQMDTPTSTNNGNSGQGYIPAIKEEDEDLQYTVASSTTTTTPPPGVCSHPGVEFLKSRSSSQLSLDHPRFRRLYSTHDELAAFMLGLECVTSTPEAAESASVKILPEKLSIKIRYLLQLFIEANCTDYALVLSILLNDAASIGRIINVVVRSESLAACHRIDAALKQLRHATFERDSLYREFVVSLYPHMYLLNQYITSPGVKSACADAGRRKFDTAMDMDMEGHSAEAHNGGQRTEATPVNHHHHHHHHHHLTNGSANWTLDKYPSEGQRFSRQSSLESVGKAGGVLANGTNGRRISKEQIARSEPGGCRLM